MEKFGCETWEYIGLPKSEHISRIRIHPKNPNIVYVGVTAIYGSLMLKEVYIRQLIVVKVIKILFVSDQAGVVILY